MKTALFSFALLVCACAHGVILDGLAAKVNDAVITVDDVGTAIGDLRRSGAIKVTGDDFKTVYSNTVEFLVERRLILQLAAEKKVTFPEWVVDGRIRDIVKDKFDGDMNKLNAMLTQIKTPLTEWRNMIRDDMIVTSMRQQFVEKYVTATPADMAREYRENADLYRTEAKTTVSVVLLRPTRATGRRRPSPPAERRSSPASRRASRSPTSPASSPPIRTRRTAACGRTSIRRWRSAPRSRR